MAVTAEEFRKTIAAFGMSEAGFSRFLGMKASTISDYATGKSRVPDLIEIIFALMRQFNVSPADARRIAGLPTENYGDRRRNRVYVGRKRKFIAEVHSAAEQRKLIRERVRADRKPKLSDYQQQEVIKRRAAGETIRSIAKSYGVQKDMISHLCKAAGVRIAPEYRELIRERIRAGRERAMANGVKFGRKPKLSDYQQQEVIKRRAAGETIRSIAKSYGVTISMITRLSKAARTVGVRNKLAPEDRIRGVPTAIARPSERD